MQATYIYTDADDAEHAIEISFAVTRGAPMTFDYPGDPDEVDWLAFTCPANPAKAIEFEAKAREDNDLAHAVDEACMEAAEAAWELSQCDD